MSNSLWEDFINRNPHRVSGSVGAKTPAKPKKTYRQLERQFQRSVVKWCREPLINISMPDLDMIYSIPNGETFAARIKDQKKKKIALGQAKLDGLHPGAYDLCLPVPRSGYAGMYIEMKSPVGKESANQIIFRQRMKKLNYYCVVCNSDIKAKDEITEYYNGGDTFN